VENIDKFKMDWVTEKIVKKAGFFESKAWANQAKILGNLGEPKTFSELCRLLRKEQGIRKPKSSVSYALRDLIQRREVIGVIDADSLRNTNGRLIPIFKLTGYRPPIHGAKPKDYRDSGADVVRLYKNEKGTPVCRQLFKKIRKGKGRTEIDGYTYRRIGGILPP